MAIVIQLDTNILVDCMIAACAILNGQRLASRNLADFQRFVPHGLKFEPVPTAPEGS